MKLKWNSMTEKPELNSRVMVTYKYYGWPDKKEMMETRYYSTGYHPNFTTADDKLIPICWAYYNEIEMPTEKDLKKFEGNNYNKRG